MSRRIGEPKSDPYSRTQVMSCSAIRCINYDEGNMSNCKLSFIDINKITGKCNQFRIKFSKLYPRL